MSDAIGIVGRYDCVKDGNGETRRERNEEFEVESPDPEIPDHGEHLWDWFWDLRQCQPGGFSGPNPISHQEYAAWVSLTGNHLSREELAILKVMDSRFCEAVAVEGDEIREREAA